MKMNIFIPVLVAVVLLCGCNKDIRIKTEKIDELTQRMFAMQQEQARQLAEMRSQLSALPVHLDKTQLDYFVRGQEKALFYQTNALFLLLAVDKKIQAQFLEAAEARVAANQQAIAIHTNETELALYCTAQITAALASQEKSIFEDLSEEIHQASATLGNNLTNLVRQLAADTPYDDRLKSIETELTQIQRDLGMVKARLGITNAAPTH